MEKKMKATCLKFVIVFMLLAAGCAQFPGERGPVFTDQEVASRPLIDQEELTGKMVALQRKLQGNSISEEDRPGAEALLEIYKLLQGAAAPSTNETQYRRLIARIYLRLERVESAFQPAGARGPSGERSTLDLFSNKRHKILETYLSGDSRGVINQVLELKNRFGPGALTPGINLVFALSLANQGMFKEAIETGERTVRELEKGPDLIVLEGKIAAWYSRLGREDAAMLWYDKMNDLMDDRTALLNHLKEDFHTTTNQQEAQLMPLPRILTMVEEKLQAHAFDQAKILLQQKRQDTALSPAERDTIDHTLERVEKTKQASQGREKEALEKIRGLVENENYADALALLEGLKSEGIQDYQVTDLQRAATEGFISRERKRAAALFLRARTAGSSLEKKEYLRQSHDILQKLLDKFPSSPSRDKILQNLEMVDRELAKW
jgi:hypothetical protein